VASPFPTVLLQLLSLPINTKEAPTVAVKSLPLVRVLISDYFSSALPIYLYLLVEGRSVQATVMDLCPGCNANSLDLTRIAFEQIANTDLGRIQIQWSYV
jgi:hypothetical protein